MKGIGKRLLLPLIATGRPSRALVAWGNIDGVTAAA